MNIERPLVSNIGANVLEVACGRIVTTRQCVVTHFSQGTRETGHPLCSLSPIKRRAGGTSLPAKVKLGYSLCRLRTRTLSIATPQVWPGRTSAQVNPLSCVNSNRNCAVVPAIPGNTRCTCWNPLESPAHADMSGKYEGSLLRGRCFG